MHIYIYIYQFIQIAPRSFVLFLLLIYLRFPAAGQADEDEVEENMRDEIPYEMETDFGVNDLPYLRVPIFRVRLPLLFRCIPIEQQNKYTNQGAEIKHKHEHICLGSNTEACCFLSYIRSIYMLEVSALFSGVFRV